MRTIFQLVLLAAISGMVPPTYAEGRCPDGYFPVGGGNNGWEGCAPMDGGSGNNQISPPNPGPLWQTRWGAIAADGNTGAFGVSNDVPSKRQAEKKATAMCKAKGGKKCRLSSVFYNQCAALAWGDASYTTFRSPEIDDAKISAVEHCEKRTTNCRIYYSACSYPVQVR